jgi:transposase
VAIDVVVERAAGLDIAKASLVACVRVPRPDGRWRVQKRKFSTMTADLLALAEWLAEHGVTRVGMESTSDYWKPVFYTLEDRFECWLLNPRHMRAVPGRKTDMTDAEWICDLIAHGLVRPSFIPPQPVRRLRDLTRRRALLLGERTREKQRMEKLLEDAGVKLSVVATDIFGASGRDMINALIRGERNPQVLADLARGLLRKKTPSLIQALVGRFDEHHAFCAAQILHHIDMINAMVADLDERIAAEIKPYQPQVELLDSVPGIDRRGAEAILAEISTDMTRFPTEHHLASWAGICPGTNQSGRRRRRGKTRHGNPWLRTAPTQSARAAARSKDTYLASHYWQLRGRRGEAKAIGATRHDILLAYYHIVRDRVPYREHGPDWLAHRHSPQHRTRRLPKQLEALGHTVTHQPAT